MSFLSDNEAAASAAAAAGRDAPPNQDRHQEHHQDRHHHLDHSHDRACESEHRSQPSHCHREHDHRQHHQDHHIHDAPDPSCGFSVDALDALDGNEDTQSLHDFIQEVDFLQDYNADLDTSIAVIPQVSMHSHSTAATDSNPSSHRHRSFLSNSSSNNNNANGSVASMPSAFGFDSERSSSALRTAASEGHRMMIDAAAATASSAASISSRMAPGNASVDADDANSVVFDSALSFRPYDDEQDYSQQYRIDNLDEADTSSMFRRNHDGRRNSLVSFSASAASSITDMEMDMDLEIDASSHYNSSMASSRSFDRSLYDSSSSFHSFTTDDGYTETEGEDERHDRNDPNHPDFVETDEVGNGVSAAGNHRVSLHGMPSSLPALGKSFVNLFANCASHVAETVAETMAETTAKHKAHLTLPTFGLHWPHAVKPPPDDTASANGADTPRTRPVTRKGRPQKSSSTKSQNSTSAPRRRLSMARAKQEARRPTRRRREDVEVSQRIYVEMDNLDVLMGRGGRSNHHEGNNIYRRRVLELQPRYKTLSHKEKTKCSADVVKWVKEGGGRFLRQDKTREDGRQWYIVPDSIARNKVAQALREDHSEHGKSMKRSRYGRPKKVRVPKPKKSPKASPDAI